MKYFKIAIFVASFFLMTMFFSFDVNAVEYKNILYLNSYHNGYAWSDDIEQGFRGVVGKEFPKTRIFTEYMDTKRVYSDEYLKYLFDIYKFKYSNRKIDIIVSSDDNAFNFLLKYRDELFPGVPIVFCGVNYFNAEKLNNIKDITGVNEKADIVNSLNLALRLHPNTKKIVFINDNTNTGRAVREEIDYQLSNLGKYEFEVLSDFTIDQILEKVESYDPLETLFFYTIYFMDKEGVSFEVGDVLSMIKERTGAPVYGAWSFSLGHGIVGGYLISGYYQGEEAGKMAVRVLKGEDVNKIPVLMKTPKRYMFDWNEVLRHGISEKDIPADSFVINKPESFFQENKVLIYSFFILLFVFILFIVIFVLFIFNRKQTIDILNDYNLKLEQRVAEKTKYLSKMNDELQKEVKEKERIEKEVLRKNASLKKFNDIAVDREVKMMELKERIKILTKDKK